MINYILAEAIKVPSVSLGVPQVGANQATLDIIINTVFVVIGAITVLFLALGGFKYILSNGDASQIKTAKNIIMYAVVGMVVSLLAFTIVQFILGRIF